MDSLADLVARNARHFGAERFWVAGDRHDTNAGFARRAARLAGALQAAGCGRGDRVAILSQNAPEYLEALAACWIAGCIAATLNFRLAAPELSALLNEIAPRAVILESEYAAVIDILRARDAPGAAFVCVGAAPPWATEFEAFLDGGAEARPVSVDPADIAHLIYTSGSTGRPKGVMRSHGAELATARTMSAAMDMRPGSRIIETMPLFHVGAQSSVLGLLWRGGGVHLHRGFAPRAILEDVAREKITHLHLVPLMVQGLLADDLAGHDTSSIETILYAAAPMPAPVLAEGLARFGPVFVNGWGLTEGTGASLAKNRHAPDGPDAALLGSIGIPHQDAAIRIVDGAGADVPPGEIGELWLRSPAVMSGYWNDHAATTEALRDGWLRTGDMGRTDARGHIFLVDRKKDMIISGGENIYSQEVERALATHPDVAGVAVIGVPDPVWGEAVRAIVVLRTGRTGDAAALIAHCREQIASYKKPRSIRFIDAFPTLPSGKIDKITLRACHGEPEPQDMPGNERRTR